MLNNVSDTFASEAIQKFDVIKRLSELYMKNCNAYGYVSEIRILQDMLTTLIGCYKVPQV